MSVVSKPSSRPVSSGGEPPEAHSVESRTPLRLSVTRGRLGLELYEPSVLGPVVVEQLNLSFLGLKFPLDLSGGVPSFRHRRGNLEQVVFRTDLEQLRKWIEPKLRNVAGPFVRPIDIWWHSTGIGIGCVRESSAIAWELHWAPLLGTARWVVSNARGWGLSSPALAEVLRIMDSLVGKVFERRGRVLVLEEVGRKLGRQLLPAVGARAPSAKEVVFGPLRRVDQVTFLDLDSTLAPVSLNVETTRIVELSELSRIGDDALANGEFDVARNAYLSALEAAPRQRDLVLLVAEIDLLLGRTEAAMGLVCEAIPILAAGTIGARLLLANGETEAATELLAQSSKDERYSPLSALMLLARAELETDGILRRLALDSAVAACPNLLSARWARLEARANFGDLAGAMADAQHLEAGSSGRRNRHEVCKRSAEILLRNGFEPEAGQWFQRALRYVPEDIDAMVGLARSLCSVGDGLRAIPLLERAVQMSESGGVASGVALVELAKLIANKLNDLPQAVARLRRVPPSDNACVFARALEGRYRFMMGDIIGASLAFSKMREVVELTVSDERATDVLLEAARFERDVMRDPAASERHLAIALRLSPRHSTVQELYREVAAVLAVRKQRAQRLAPEQVGQGDIVSEAKPSDGQTEPREPL